MTFELIALEGVSSLCVATHKNRKPSPSIRPKVHAPMKGKIQDIKGIGDHSMVKAKGCPSPLGPTTSPDIQIRANTLSTYIEELKSQEMWVREARCCVDTFDNARGGRRNTP